MIIAILLLIGSVLNTMITGLSIINMSYIIVAVIVIILSIPKIKSILKSINYKNSLLNLQNYIYICMGLILVILSVLSNPYKEENAYYNQLDDAYKHALDGKGSKVDDICEELLEEDPEDVNALLIFGVLHMNDDDYTEAIGYLKQANNIAPYNPDVLHNLALCYYSEGINNNSNESLNTAINYYMELIKLDPRIIKPHIYIGQVAMQLERYQMAKHHLEFAYRLAPEDPSVLWALTEYYYNIHDKQNAIKCIDEAVKLRIDNESKSKFEDLRDEIYSELGGE